MIYSPTTSISAEQKENLSDKIAQLLSRLLSDQYGREIVVSLEKNEKEGSK